MPTPANQRDYFAEMYVAGILADEKWNVYFPRRDQGFDFVITKKISDELTPEFFVDGNLVGWGREFFSDFVQKFEIRFR